MLFFVRWTQRGGEGVVHVLLTKNLRRIGGPALGGDGSGLARRRQLLDAGVVSDNSPRPSMHTFFEPIGKGSDANSPHQRLVQEWKSYWYEAGWNPVVLSLDDAKKHPEFDRIWKIVSSQGYNTYEVLCYVRWLAMAAVGGGWMSDYDTFPLHDFRQDGLVLPNNGKFTVYESWVPSLMSGNEQEWLRMTNAIVNNLDYKMKHPGEIPKNFVGMAFSDMLSMMDLMRNDSSVFVSKGEVLTKFTNIMKTDWAPQACITNVPANQRAVHFAHYYTDLARKQGFFPGVAERDDWDVNVKRIEMARWWMNYWKEHCEAQVVH